MNVNITSLLAAADALDCKSGPVLNYEDRDRYGRALDVLDALGLIQNIRVNDAGPEPFEVAQLTDADKTLLVGPFGFTPSHDRQQPTEKLAARELPDTEAVLLLERVARNMTSGEAPQGTMSYTQRLKAGVALSRLLRDAGHEYASAPLPVAEATDDAMVVQMPRRLHVAVAPLDGEGA